jgi:hypothetical protein
MESIVDASERINAMRADRAGPTGMALFTSQD